MQITITFDVFEGKGHWSHLLFTAMGVIISINGIKYTNNLTSINGMIAVIIFLDKFFYLFVTPITAIKNATPFFMHVIASGSNW